MIENVSTQLTVFHCFAHCLLPGRASASLYALLFLEKEAEIGGRDNDQTEAFFLLKAKDAPSKIWVFYSVYAVFSPSKERPAHQAEPAALEGDILRGSTTVIQNFVQSSC